MRLGGQRLHAPPAAMTIAGPAKPGGGGGPAADRRQVGQMLQQRVHQHAAAEALVRIGRGGDARDRAELDAFRPARRQGPRQQRLGGGRCGLPQRRSPQPFRQGDRPAPAAAVFAGPGSSTVCGAAWRRSVPSQASGTASKARSSAPSAAKPCFDHRVPARLHRPVAAGGRPAADQQPVLGPGQRHIEQAVVFLGLPLLLVVEQAGAGGAAQLLARRPEWQRDPGVRVACPGDAATHRCAASRWCRAGSRAAPAAPWRRAPSSSAPRRRRPPARA